MWKELFAPHILQRGYDYYQEGRVWDIERLKDKTIALVSGSEDYQVTILATPGNPGVLDIECTCPYAADGRHCKHEAAVLYKLEEMENGEQETVTDFSLETPMEGFHSTQMELKEIIDRISEEEIRALLYSLAKEDESLRNRIMVVYSSKMSERQLLDLKKEIESIRYDYSDRSGYVDWRNASDYIWALSSFLENTVQPLIERGFLMEAFELTSYVFLMIGNTDIDDDGDVPIGARHCLELWQQIAGKADDAQQMYMYQWTEDHFENGSVIDYMDEYIDTFRMTGFHSQELLHKRLAELDARIREDEARYRGEPVSPSRWSHPYWLPEEVLLRIQTMKELGYPREDILAYYEKYRELPSVTIALAEEYVHENNIAEAVEILQKAKQRDTDHEKAVSAYSKRLIELYRESGKQQSLEQELVFQITQCKQTDLLYIDSLRELAGQKKWPAYRSRILSSDSCAGIKDELYASEGMLPELMQHITDTGNMYLLEKYEKMLKKKFPETIRDMYAAYVRAEACRVSYRKQYQQLVANLKKVTRYPGGKELASSIAGQWRQEYSRKTAFMDELRKAGF